MRSDALPKGVVPLGYFLWLPSLLMVGAGGFKASAKLWSHAQHSAREAINWPLRPSLWFFKNHKLSA